MNKPNAAEPQDLFSDILGGSPKVVHLHSALDVPIGLTIFPTVQARKAEPKRLSLRQLEAIVRQTRAEAKSGLPLVKLATFGDTRSKAGSLRHDSNLLRVTGIEGDYDAGKVSPDDAAAKLRRTGIAGLIYTSTHHTPEVTPVARACPAGR